MVLTATSCGTPAKNNGAASTPTEKHVTLTVYAAASLSTSFATIDTAFEAAHPGVTVTAVFDGSPTLVTQLNQGAKADVFASADEANMADAHKDGVIGGSPVTFATNRLAIAVPKGNPAKITTLADLAKPGVRVVICAPQVPCGALANTVLNAAKVTIKPVSLEQSVSAVDTKVAIGEADAGLVYTTDITASKGKLVEVPDPSAFARFTTAYPIATVAHSPNPALAHSYIAFVTGTDGQKILHMSGFGAP